MEEAVSERRKVYAAAHRSDEYRQAYISASRHALSDIDKAKAKAWQVTCSSLSSKSNPKSVSLLRSVAGSSSSSSSYLTFPNCSSRESTSVFADNLRSHFSIFQPKASRSIARGYLFELRRATCPKEYHSSFCTTFSSTVFLAAATNLSLSTATGPDKLAYPMLKHLPRSGINFLLLYKKLCFDWSAGVSTDVFFSIRANVRPPSSWWIPTKLISSPISSYSTPASVSIPLQPSLGSLSTLPFPFLNMHFC